MNDEDALFWIDVWVGNITLCVWFRVVFSLDRNKDCEIKDRWRLEEWVWHWHRDVRVGLGYDQLEAMSILLVEFPFVFSARYLVLGLEYRR